MTTTARATRSNPTTVHVYEKAVELPGPRYLIVVHREGFSSGTRIVGTTDDEAGALKLRRELAEKQDVALDLWGSV